MVQRMDLVRQLLLDIEQAPASMPLTVGPYPSYAEDGMTAHDVFEHLQDLLDAGFIRMKGRAKMHNGLEQWSGLNLTWEGQAFLKNIKNDSVWERAKKYVGEKVGSASIVIAARMAGEILAKELFPDG